MFGSKKNKSASTKSKVDVSIKTMDNDVKGSGAKNVSIDYEKNNITGNNATANSGNQTSQAMEKSPFQNETPQAPEPSIANKNKTTEQSATTQLPHGLPRGSFLMAGSNFSETEGVKNTATFSSEPNSTGEAVSTEKPFLHETTDSLNKDKVNQVKSNAIQNTVAKKSGMSSIIWVIAFILLLATILLGGYYFYMKQGSKKTATPVTKTKNTTQQATKRETQMPPQEQQTKPVANRNNQATQQQTMPKKEKPKVPSTFIASEATFASDLHRFVSILKQGDNATALKAGIIVTPMINETTAFPAQVLIKSMKMTAFLKDTDLKPACKLFVMQDTGKIRTALIFELNDGVDAKIVKDNIIKNEISLPATIKPLFMDNDQIIIPTTIKFSVNPDNLNSRYFNYKPGDTFSSVDWNILDLGQGKIIYFATSKNLAEKVTNYFTNLIVK